jgi:hypothetical protein
MTVEGRRIYQYHHMHGTPWNYFSTKGTQSTKRIRLHKKGGLSTLVVHFTSLIQTMGSHNTEDPATAVDTFSGSTTPAASASADFSPVATSPITTNLDPTHPSFVPPVPSLPDTAAPVDTPSLPAPPTYISDQPVFASSTSCLPNAKQDSLEQILRKKFTKMCNCDECAFELYYNPDSSTFLEHQRDEIIIRPR